MTIKKILEQSAREVEAFLEVALKKRDFGPLNAPMNYALMNGGKRLRAFLVMQSARVYDVDPNVALFPAGAIEAVHAYSLVHDDMPAMDDDDLRRGKPTVHKKWDEATAVLVGDGLQSFGFELASDPIMADKTRADLVLSLAKASGAEGMVRGQALDIEAEKRVVSSEKEIEGIQRGKTGALIAWSAEAGARLGGAPPEKMTQYAHHIGLAFQIQDDILDVEGDEARMGKRLRKDEEAGKSTFVSLLGLEGAKIRARREIEGGISALDGLPRAEHLIAIARYILKRQN